MIQGFSFGEPGATRTRDLQSRSLTLYPTELRVHVSFGQPNQYITNGSVCQGVSSRFLSSFSVRSIMSRGIHTLPCTVHNQQKIGACPADHTSCLYSRVICESPVFHIHAVHAYCSDLYPAKPFRNCEW